MDLQLRNRLALVTGSTAGIGYAIAETLAGEGVRGIVNGRSDEAVDRGVARLTEATSGTVVGFAGDLSDAAAQPGDLRGVPCGRRRHQERAMTSTLTFTKGLLR